MKLKLKNKIDTSVGLVSATDIMSLLLIFCMLMVSSGAPNTLKINLPVSNNTDNLVPQLNITITANLDYYVDGNKVVREGLKELIIQKLNSGKQNVLLYIDKTVPVEHMIYVTDIAASMNAKVAVATKPE